MFYPPIHQFIITKSACIIKTYLINSQFLKYSRYINPLYSPTDLYYNKKNITVLYLTNYKRT